MPPSIPGKQNSRAQLHPFFHISATPAPIPFPSASRISHSTHSLGLCNLALAVVKAGEPLLTPALPTEVMVCFGRESDIGGACFEADQLTGGIWRYQHFACLMHQAESMHSMHSISVRVEFAKV